jgi:dipeptidyl-peptidase 4
MGDPAVSFPRQEARTRRFSLGAPRSFTVSPDGERVVFLRSPAGDNPVTSLWVFDAATGVEREVASAAGILGGNKEELSDEERARRERSREVAGGIVGYACDEDVRHAAFTLGGRLWWTPLGAGLAGGEGPAELAAPPGVVDPRPSPTGQAVAFLSGPGLYVVPTSGGPSPGGQAALLAEEEGVVTWGAAEFAAAEEMGRARGFWWAPDGGSLLAARVDNSPVTKLWTSDPSTPESKPQPHYFPLAGTADALVSLWHLEPSPGGSRRSEVSWDAERYPYLVDVHWSRWGPPLLLVEQRDHKACAVLGVDLVEGTTSQLVEASDAAWVASPPGVPAWLEDGQLLWGVAETDTWRLKVGDELITPPGLQVRGVTHAGSSVLFSASSDPEVVEAWSWSKEAGLVQLTDLGGVSSAIGDGPVKVVVSRSMSHHGVQAVVHVDGSEPRALVDRSETPVVDPVVRFLKVGPRQLRVGVLLPTGHDGAKLPVIVAPYGGPGHQKAMAARSAWLEAQWLADQGFAVVVADGRGTPGRGPSFEREVYLDLAGPPLQDQVEALRLTADEVPELDLGRVGIVGWSFGGYLAALAVLARPDVFHAAVAGAPVTDWRWYDTYYTERYLGHPDRSPEAYERSSLMPLAANLARPLLLVHGLSDDNVYVVHTLELSSALLAAGRPHSVLPLSGVTHVASREDVAENLLLSQVDFLRSALARPLGSAAP